MATPPPRLLSVLVALATVLVGWAAVPAGASTAISWQACNQSATTATGIVYQCATVPVPLDYRQSDGATIAISLMRIPATDPANRIGSILLNPGGPGGSGIDYLTSFGPYVGAAYGPDIPKRFDLISFDPRGIGRSNPILCYASQSESATGSQPLPFPLTADDERKFEAAGADLAANCSRRAADLGPHLSTANVARDVDRIRADLGEDTLNFIGMSYGTFLGATYASLYPSRVRSMVADGVLDPRAWVNQGGAIPFTTAVHSELGSLAALNAFFRDCDRAQPGHCALAPGSAQRFAALAASVRRQPRTVLDVQTGKPFVLTYNGLIAGVVGALYSPYSFSALGKALAQFERPVTSPLALGRAVAAVDDQLGYRAGFDAGAGAGSGAGYMNVVEGFAAVGCVDSDNPNRYAAWTTAGAVADRTSYFGGFWTWMSSACAQWPFRDADRYTGPFTARTANPVLIVGNLGDPATRYQGAEALHSLLPNSGLLTVDAAGHTSLGISSCAGYAIGRYLVDPMVAQVVDGATCPQEFNPFDQAATSSLAPQLAARLGVPAEPTEISARMRQAAGVAEANRRRSP